MSAFPTSPQPAPTGPRLVPAPEPPPRGKGPIYVLIILIAAGAVWFLRPHQQKAARTVVVPTVKALRGTLRRSQRLSGSITAGRYANVVVPILQAPDTGRGMTITYLAPSGSWVKEGDLLAEIDAQDMRDHLDDVEASLIQADLDIKKRESVLTAQMEAIKQRVRVSLAQLLKAKEDMKALEVRSAIQQEQYKLALEEYQAQYDEVEKEVALKQESLDSDMAIMRIGRRQQVWHRDRHRNDVARCRIISPMSGMVVLQTTVRNGDLNQIQVGERVYPGQPFMRIVDPNSMQLAATVNQTDAERIRLGQAAEIRFDAFPDIVLSGKVQAVGALAIGGRRTNYYIRNVPVRVAITSSNARVIPDLTASADVVTSTAEGLIVPREAVEEASGKTIVYVKKDGGFAPREVGISGENNTQVAVAGGLQEGEEIAIAPHSVIFP